MVPCYGIVMDERQYLVKAQEADAMANSVNDPRDRKRWEDIAREYRRLAKVVAGMRRTQP